MSESAFAGAQMAIESNYAESLFVACVSNI